MNMSMIQVTVKTNQTNLMALEAHSRFTLIKCKISRFWTEYVSVSRLTVAVFKFACGFQRKLPKWEATKTLNNLDRLSWGD